MKKMGMKKYILILFILGAFSFVSDGWKSIYSIKKKCDFFTTDNIGNLYFVQGDEIKKFNPSGELLKVYSNKKLGRITSIDASNPLRVLVFYKDFAQLIFLDSQLSQNGESISLENMLLEQSDLACNSFNNGVWLYNRQNAELVRLDDNLIKVVSTGNLNRLLNTELHPNFLMEHNEFVYLNNVSEGIFVFDIYGTYYKTIPVKGTKSFQLRDNELFYYSENKFNVYNTKLLSTNFLPLKDSAIVQMRAEKNRYYLQYTDSLVVSEIEKK